MVDQPIAVSGDEGDVPTTSIQPIGLLINELVTNAAKHGRGPIEVEYRLTNGARQLSVTDGGAGLPLDFSPDEERGSIGMRVVAALTSQLGGRLDIGRRADGSGCRVTISF